MLCRPQAKIIIIFCHQVQVSYRMFQSESFASYTNLYSFRSSPIVDIDRFDNKAVSLWIVY